MKPKILNGLFCTTTLSKIPKNPYTFQGKITKLDAPIGKGVPVALHDRATGACIEITETNAESLVSFQNLDKTLSYYIVAIDTENLFQSIVYDLTWLNSDNFDYMPKLRQTDKLAQSPLKDFYNYYQQESLVQSDATVFSISKPSLTDDNKFLWNVSGIVSTDIRDEFPLFLFNGSSRYLYLDSTPTYARQAFTFETFFQIDNLASSSTHYLFTQISTGTLRQSFYINNQGFLIFNREFSPSVTMRSISKITDGWNHAALSFDGNALYLFLNGKLEATLNDNIGLQGFQNHFGLGDLLSGSLSFISWRNSCEYVTDFKPVKQVYTKSADNDPEDIFSTQVVLKTEPRTDSLQSLMVDKAKNMPFTVGATTVTSNSVQIANTFARSAAMSSDYVLTGDFCIELTYRLRWLGDYPTLISNQSATTEWITNNWAITVGRSSSKDKYAIYRTNLSALLSSHPILLQEITTLAIDKQGSTVKLFFNGFLIDTFLNVTPFDTRLNSFMSFGRDISYTLYDAKVTNGASRYQSNYSPTWLTTWEDQPLAAQQHLIIELTFKTSLFNFLTFVQPTLTDVVLTSNKSINGTKSAFFSEAQLNVTTGLYVPNEMFTMELQVTVISHLEAVLKTVVQLYTATTNILTISYNNELQLFYTLGDGIPTAIEGAFLNDSFKHIVIQRQGDVFKILLEGLLVAEIPFTVKFANVLLSVMASLDKANSATGYVNNLRFYKNFLKYEDIYEVPVEEQVVIVVEKDPEVIITSFTTSALDFESNLTDMIQNTVWNVEGSASLQTTNKVFGTLSLETKALGDGLVTNSPVLTGGAKPFTVEFYALVSSTQPSMYDYVPLFTNDYTTADQGLYFFKSNKTLVYYRSNNSNIIDVEGQSKVNANEINKITLTYDGACLRVFVNDILDLIYGVSSPIVKQNVFALFKSKNSAVTNSLNGLLDNVNIHDSVALKVRNLDPYEEFLVVDLAFDGENDSTKIIDNGTEKLNWVVNGNAQLLTAQPFDGFSSLSLNGSNSWLEHPISTTFDFSGYNDFTISFEFMCTEDKRSYFFSQNDNESFIDGIGIYWYSRQIHVYGYANNGDSYITCLDIKSQTNLNVNQKYRFTIVRSNMLCKLYVDGINVNSVLMSQPMSYIPSTVRIGADNISDTDPYGNTWRFKGYIKNFKIYKGVAVTPEDPTGKIQLDFDNNLDDKYGNSTWTSNDVTFDQANSVKGLAAYFASNNQRITGGKNSNFNFDRNNFHIALDAKALANRGTYAEIFSSGQTSWENGCATIGWFNNGTMRMSTYSNNVDTNVGSIYLPNDSYYNINFNRIDLNMFVIVNDVLVSTYNLKPNTTFNFNANNNTCIGHALWSGSNGGFKGYIDNFKTVKDYQGEAAIDNTAVHLPLETNDNNLGFTNLTVNSVGNPTYHIVDGKKCMKFESGRYLTINSNNIFNLEASPDFYIEFDFYPLSLANSPALFDSFSSTTNTYQIQATSTGLLIYIRAGASLTTDLIPIPNTWNNLKLFRKNQQISMVLNDTVRNLANSPLLNDATVALGAQVAWRNASYDFNGYMSNFKMFVGTYEIPKTYNDKKVLDLDFKPTGKSYLFKDNNNKCIIHPVNIIQRDYQDSEYCCYFNGINQYLQLGKNALFNIGNDDFVLSVKFKFQKRGQDLPLLTGGVTTNTDGYWYIQVRSENSATNPLNVEFVYRVDASNVYTIYCNQPLIENKVYEFTVAREGSTMTAYLNDIPDFTVIDNRQPPSFNLNGSENTYIGVNQYNSSDWIYKGYIYHVKFARNTSDKDILKSP